jgi:hypothetical protein
LEHLRCLLCKIGLANDFAISIKCSLAGDENDASAANFHNLRIAWWDTKFGWVIRLIETNASSVMWCYLRAAGRPRRI